jgi:uncharacterized phiE125 gp8 family phage protein
MICYRALTRTITGSEPLTLVEAKAHLRIDEDYENDLLNDLISTAREKLEQDTQRTLPASTWTVTMDAFPSSTSCVIELPMPPAIAVTSINYVDPDGTVTLWSSANYVVDANTTPGYVRLVYGEDWPDTRDERGAVRIIYTAGYTTHLYRVKQAMRLLIGHLYENREAVLVSQGFGQVTLGMGYESLVASLSWGGTFG